MVEEDWGSMFFSWIKYSTLCTEKDNLGCLRHLIVSVRDAEHLNTS